MQQVCVFGEIVEMLVHPMFKYIEHSELDRLCVFLLKPFLILGVSHLAGLVGLFPGELGPAPLRLEVRRLGDVKAVNEQVQQFWLRREE